MKQFIYSVAVQVIAAILTYYLKRLPQFVASKLRSHVCKHDALYVELQSDQIEVLIRENPI